MRFECGERDGGSGTAFVNGIASATLGCTSMFTFAAQKSIWSSVLALALSGMLGSAEAAESGAKSKDGAESTGKGKTSSGATTAPATTAPTKPAVKAPAKVAEKGSDKSAQRALRGTAAVEAEAEENSRFEAARALAFEDGAVKKLREKAENVTGDAEGTKALKDYLKALYGKMRSLEPTLKERIDLTEAAALRQLERPAPAK